MPLLTLPAFITTLAIIGSFVGCALIFAGFFIISRSTYRSSQSIPSSTRAEKFSFAGMMISFLSCVIKAIGAKTFFILFFNIGIAVLFLYLLVPLYLKLAQSKNAYHIPPRANPNRN